MRKASSVWKSSLKRLGLGQSRKSHGRMRPARTLRYEALEARELLSVCYVDAGDGNDSWNGLYPYHTSGNNGPWRSIGKVNNARLEGGDYVLFQRGEVWQGEQLIPKSGSWGKPITYAAYGTGAKPVFRGSSQLNSTSHWINLGNNRWLTQPVFNADVGNIVFNQGPSCGVRKWSPAGLAKQGDFYVHRVAPFPFYKAILYSTSNPAVYYTDIQMALKRDIISQGGKSNITYRNLDLRYGAAHGIGGGDVHQITVLDCDFSYLGGGLDPETERRYGNGIEFWGDASGCIVDRCKFWQIYDAAITNQYVGDSPCTQYKIGYRNNIIRQCEYSFEFFADAGSTVRHVYFENNTCVDAGYGWGHWQRTSPNPKLAPNRNGRHVMLWKNKSNVDNFYIRNNIFSRATQSDLRLDGPWHDIAGLTLDYNLYYAPTVACWAGTDYTMAHFAQYQAASGKDAHSRTGKPLFVDAASRNYHLQPGSPAIDHGVTNALATDHDGISRPQGAGYDIGAYEYVNLATPPGMVAIDWRDRAMVAQYAGTADFASISDSLRQTIGTAMIQTTMHASSCSSSLSQSVDFTFNAGAGVGTPFDPMASLDEDDLLRTVMLDPNGQAGLSTPLFNSGAGDADSKACATGSPAPEVVDALLAAILTDSDSWEGFDLPTTVWAKDQKAGSDPVFSCPLDGS